MNNIDEGFFSDLFKDKYQKYKAAVINELKKRGINALALGHYFETYCRDFFLDRMSVFDCADAFAENKLAREQAAIAEAKRIMREHGYRVRTLKG